MKTRNRKRPSRETSSVRLRRRGRSRLDEEGAARQPVLRFSPPAWAKLHFFCHQGETEIGGFGITRPDDLLLVEDFLTVRQQVTSISVAFEDEAVADFFDAQVDQGRRPEQFARIWLHTHPGNCIQPSGIDDETFARVFGRCDWAVMCISARTGRAYARLTFNVGPGGSIIVPVRVDYDRPFAGSDRGAWRAEYEQNVHVVPLGPSSTVWAWSTRSGSCFTRTYDRIAGSDTKT